MAADAPTHLVHFSTGKFIKNISNNKIKYKKSMEAVSIKVENLEINRGQIYGLPKNPRFIKDARFEALKKSISDAPEMLNLRELLVYPIEGTEKYVIIGGNMRFRACQDLGFEEIPCKVLPLETPVAKLREYTIKDNESFGNTDWDILANEWSVEELQDWGMECSFLGGEESDLDDFFEEATETQKEEKEKDIVISVTIPVEESDSKDAILEILTQALEEYPNVTIA